MKNKIRKIMSIIVTVSLLLSYVSQSIAAIAEPMASLSPLQERLDRDANVNEASIDEQDVDNGFSMEQQIILDEINNNPISTIGDSDENNAISENVTMDISDSEVALLSSTTTSIPDNFRISPIENVYNVYNNNNDYVSQATGALSYKKNILTLSGKNNLDLELSIQYNSGNAIVTENEFDSEEDGVRNINFNSFAVGWSFGFPTIIRKYENYGWKQETSLIFPDGNGYTVKDDVTNPSTDKTLELELYSLSDMTLVKKAETNNYELSYTNGTVYTFDGTYGNLINIRDVYGNEIELYYTEYDYYRGSFYDHIYDAFSYRANLNALTKIVDSTGREIDIEYKIKNTIYGNEVSEILFTMENVVYATLKLTRIDNYEGVSYIVSEHIDAEGNVTKYRYDEKVTHIYEEVNLSHPTYTVNGSAVLLTGIDLPSGGWIKYDYERARRAYGYYEGGYVATFWYEVTNY